MIGKGADAGEPGAPATAQPNYARLRVAVGPLLGPAVCRVVSGVAAHADCPTDRLDDALLICDAIAAHAPAHALDNHVSLTVTAAVESLELRVGELAHDGARQLVADSRLPGVGSVLERVASGLRVERADGGDALLIEIGFVPAATPR